MSTKTLCLFSLFYLAAFFTSGLALKCLICGGGDNGYCKPGQVGESAECGREVKNAVCYEVEGNEDGVTTNLMRLGCIGLEDAKRKSKKYGITLGDSKNKCESVYSERERETITACVCDTEDCNSKYELPEKKVEEEVTEEPASEDVVDNENRGMGLVPISTIGMVLFNILINSLY